MAITNFSTLVHEMGPAFAARAADADATDTFVGANYPALKANKLFSAGAPAELGGGGASHAELCEMLRELAHYCSSTALAFSMHTHLVALPAWRWRNEGGGFGEGLLRRVAAEELILVSTGASDWLDSSGTLTRVEGGYRLSGRKVFGSGAPAGELLVTSGVFEDPEAGPTVLHFAMPLKTEGVTVLDNWRTLGMRGTGSNDIVIENAFVPEAAISGKRPRGAWGPLHHVVMLALPIVFAVYTGVAEAAREIALAQAKKKAADPDVRLNVAEMENQLRATQMALASVIDIAAHAKPGPETTNEILIRRTLLGQAAIRTVECAMEVAGGAGFFRPLGLERLFRDVQGARYHPMTAKRQLDYTGRFTLGLDIG
jgi:acyl-CoA dehydrogenase